MNYLELKSIYLAITPYKKFWAGCTPVRSHQNRSDHIRVRSDNTTALAYVNNMLRSSIKFLQQIG